MKTTGYRYTLNAREACPHNFCPRFAEITYFATSLDFAKNPHVVPTVEGWDIFKVEPNAEEIKANLFDMENGFRDLEAVKKHISITMDGMRADYESGLDGAKTEKERKMWRGFIERIDNGEEWEERLVCLKYHCFNGIGGPDANLEYKADLVKELKAKGYDGYIGEKQIALFGDKK